MRLAILGPSHHPVAEPYAAGQERFTADLARGLRHRGHWLRAFAEQRLIHWEPSSPRLFAAGQNGHPPIHAARLGDRA